jgi:Nidogen-like/PEP-CTERM motif
MTVHSTVRRAALFSALAAASLQGQAIRSTSSFNMFDLARNDDGSTGLVTTGFNMNFFGNIQNNLYVNNNGNVTFTASLSTYTPSPIASSGLAIIAPFWADVDTRNASSALTRYGTGVVDGRNAFAVDWLGVGYYAAGADKLNTFQLIMIDRSDTGEGNFDFEFNYASIQWDTGAASGGQGGLCTQTSGSPARVGYANGGSGGALVTEELAGSGVCGAFLDRGANALNGGFVQTRSFSGPIDGSLSTAGTPGRFTYSVRAGVVVPPESTVPEPSTYALMATGLVGLAGFARRRRVVS